MNLRQTKFTGSSERHGMRRLLPIVAILLAAPLAWTEGCKTPENFAALVELVVNVGQSSDYGLTLMDDEKSQKYYASLVRADFPELHLTQEKWTRRRRRDRVDQWIMIFTVDGTSVLHKQLVEKNHRLVGEKRLSNKGADRVECNVFRVFLPALRNSKR
jgi:hypothetical protein